MSDRRPGFRVLANGTDITAALAPRFKSIRVTDDTGLQSDECEIVLADDGQIAWPDTGATLEVWLGYGAALARLGAYQVDEVGVTGPAGELRITARAAPQAVAEEAIQGHRSRPWPAGTTLGAMVAKIAQEHGLEPAIAPGLAEVALPHVDQLNESDMHLLTRIARDHGAVVKPVSGRLVVVRLGQSETAAGKDIPGVRLTRTELKSWTGTLAKRGPFGTVKAKWRDLAAGADAEAVAGDQAPVKILRNTYPDAASALAAATAELERSRRATQTLSLQLPGRNDIIAEQPLTLVGVREGLDGDWLIRRVEHTLDAGGYRLGLEAELPRDEALAADPEPEDAPTDLADDSGDEAPE